MAKIITICDKAQWVGYIKQAAESDFYHTWHYHSLDTGGEPILFVSEILDDFIAFPFLKRAIEGTAYFDLSCVYGYSGPVSNLKMEEIDDKLIEHFVIELKTFLEQEKVVSVFSRLHPFYKQTRLLQAFGGVHSNGKTVYIDLTTDVETQCKKYQLTTRVSIRKLRDNNKFRFAIEKGPLAVAKFKAVYTESMKRIGANESYFFNEEYFTDIVNTSEYDARIVMIYDQNVLVSSSLVMLTNGIMQAHLIGTNTDYIKFSPTRLMVDEVAKMGRESGVKYYNLGGGVGFKEDNVYNWKLCFTDNTLDFNTWRYIANAPVYQQLLNNKNLVEADNIDFFPLYRYS